MPPYWRRDTTENRLELLRGLAGGGTIHVHDRDHGPLLDRLIDEDLILPVAHHKTAVDYTISRKGRALLERFGLAAPASDEWGR